MKDECSYLHQLCESGCDKYVCRAFFPERQPIVKPEMVSDCSDPEYAEVCPQRLAGIQWSEEKRARELTEKCPFAVNPRCSRPWEWHCYGGISPYKLTTFESKPGKPEVPARNEDGSIKFTYNVEDVQWACLGGDPEVYTKCPRYIAGVQYKKDYERIKGHP